MKAKQVSVILGAFVSTMAMAQNNRSFVSTAGSDANSCAAGNECRSFVRAIAVTNPGGQILAIASGGYGTFAISQSVTVAGAEGVNAAITVTSGYGILISAGGFDQIALRNLEVFVGGTSVTAIRAQNYGSLAIEKCRVSGGAIYVAGSATSSALISDTVVRWGFSSFTIASPASLVRCQALGANGYGLYVADGVIADGRVSAVDFASVGCNYGAAVSGAQSGHKVSLTLDRALMASNAFDGISSESLNGCVVDLRVSNSTVVDNGRYGFNKGAGSTFSSMQNNLVAGNATSDINGTIDPITVH